MSWQQIIGHQRQQEMFANAMRRSRLGHAYLFAGPDGIGKKLFAKLLAQSLLCEQKTEQLLRACGECSSCRQVISGTHPDLMQLELPEGKSELPIELFVGPPEKRGKMGLCHELSLSPMQGGHRVAIIDDADKMNIASGNSLLKTLEEPGPGAILILLTVDPDQVLQTIRSRCQSVFFGSLEPNEIAAVLQMKDSTSDEVKTSQAIQRAHGSAGKAIAWLEQSEEQSGVNTDAILKIFARGRFRAVELATVSEVIMSQCKSDPFSKRKAAIAIVEACLNWFHDALTDTKTAGISLNLRDAWVDAMEQCFLVIGQISRHASVGICLDAFYHDLEIALRPTWNSTASRS